MGVRFECPAGHKLHVKADLAGKRGICPECGAKFIVPSFSGQRVSEDSETTAPAAAFPAMLGGGLPDAATLHNEQASAASPSATPPPQAPSSPPPPAPAPEPVSWYLRPAAGGQYGPANDETFRQWIAEGRVAAECWVWRTGWTDWKAGSEALSLVNSAALPAPAEPLSAPAADVPKIVVDEAAPAGVAALTVSAAAPVDPTSAAARRAELKRRKQKVRNFSIALTVVALGMLVALVVVLAR